MRLRLWAIALALIPALARADATIPVKDIAGARDSPVLKRYEGTLIVSYDRVRQAAGAGP